MTSSSGAMKARASQARQDETKTGAKRRREALGNEGTPMTRPYATPDHDAYDDVVEASFPASDPPPYVRDPAGPSSDHPSSHAIQGAGSISLAEHIPER